MLIEDPIIRKSREKIQAAIDRKFQDEGTRLYVDKHLYQILETICNFYDNKSADIYTLPSKDDLTILGILNRNDIHFSPKEYHCLRGVIRTVLKERYRSLFAKYPEDLPERISANAIYGEYSFDDLICLNDTDFDQLKRELRASKSDRLPILRQIVSEISDSESSSTRRYLSFNNLPYTKSLRRYQRLRILDNILASTPEPLDLNAIHKKMLRIAKDNRIDPDTLWKVNSYEAQDRSDYKRNIESIYKHDFLALAELIAPSDKTNKRRKDVYRFDGFGGRCYLERKMTAFKLVIPSSLAVIIYEEFLQTEGRLEDFSYWKMPLIYAIARFGKYHEKRVPSKGAYNPDYTHSMKYYKTGTMLDYNDDEFCRQNDLESLFEESIFE
ncbi:MAG: hypothetical protein K2H60_00325 [Muribaculaceae bacterium]|nr:hypothetical protein [Muribaculaceae bacterium]